MNTVFSLEQMDGCVVVRGEMTAEALSEMLKVADANAVIDTDAARVLGAPMVFGTHEALDQLKSSEAYRSQARERALRESQGIELSQQALNWLIFEQRGASSSFMFGYLTGVKLIKDGVVSTPLDANDFRRCRILLETVPELALRFDDIRNASPMWDALVENWDTICQVMDSESPEWRDARGSCKLTNAEIRRVRESVDGR